MELGRDATSTPKILLVVVCACAFLSVSATFDSSEHHRAWKTALGWTERQQAAASAADAESMYPLSLCILVDDTLIVALSFITILVLVVAVARESGAALAAVKALVMGTLALGLLYSALMLAYRFQVGPRRTLKGPIFDYDLRLSPLVVLALLGFPATSVAYFLYSWRRRVKIS